MDQAESIRNKHVVSQTPVYEGKSKALYLTDDDNIMYMEFKDDITAGNGQMEDVLPDKGKLNQTISKKIYEYLMERKQDREGKKFITVGHLDNKHLLNLIQTHYISSPELNAQFVKKCDIIPVEVVIRNYAAGSICERYNIEKGHKFKTPLLELFYKDDSLNDPLCSDTVVTEMGWAAPHVLAEIKRQAYILNHNMVEFWESYNLTLVDQKFEFGIDSEGSIMLADEITCDSQRLWDDLKRPFDKDVYRAGQAMENVSDVYNYIHRLIDAELIKPIKEIGEVT